MQFHYKVRDRSGRLVEGVMESESREVLAERLKLKGYYVTSISRDQSGQLLQREITVRRRLPVKTLAVLCRQLSIMVGTGMLIVNCLQTLQSHMKDSQLKKALEEIRRDVLAGSSLAKSMARFPRVFPEMMVHLVEAGETAGSLHEILNQLATYYERQDEVRSNTKEALTYPSVVAVGTVTTIAILVLFVLPTFVDVFASLEIELPRPTKVILGLRDFAVNRWYVLLTATVGIFAAGRWYLGTPTGKRMLDSLMLNLPVISGLTKRMLFARFTRTLSLLVRSGITMVEALRISERIVLNSVVAESISRAREAVERGTTVSAAFSNNKIFPAMVVDMLTVGEETGSLDRTLEQVADYYDNEVKHTVNRLTALIEPVIILVLAGIVLLIVGSVMMPLFEMYKAY